MRVCNLINGLLSKCYKNVVIVRFLIHIKQYTLTTMPFFIFSKITYVPERVSAFISNTSYVDLICEQLIASVGCLYPLLQYFLVRNIGKYYAHYFLAMLLRFYWLT